MSKTLGEMTPDERKAAIDRALGRLQAELTAAAPAISRIMDEADAEAEAEFKRAHRATWWVYPEPGNTDRATRIRHTAGMRGTWGYDVTCSCGWESVTGGGLRRYVRELLDDHRRDARH